MLPSIEKESQGPGEIVMPKRKSLLQKKMAAKSQSMVQQIAGTGAGAGVSSGAGGSKEGGMAAMSFGGQMSEEKGPVRAAGVCPVAHTPTVTDAETSAVSLDTSNSDRDQDGHSDSGAEPMLSSQPFLEQKPDALPEIQVRHVAH